MITFQGVVLMKKISDFGFGYREQLEKARRYEKFDSSPFGEKFPFTIERKKTDSDDFYKGLCEGAKAVYDMWKKDLFEDSSFPVTYFSTKHISEDRPTYEDVSFCDKGYKLGHINGVNTAFDIYDPCGEWFDEDCFANGYIRGFTDGFEEKIKNLIDEKRLDPQDHKCPYSSNGICGEVVCNEKCPTHPDFIDDEYDDCFEDDLYDEGFDDGFRIGYQSASDETSSEIYVDANKICKIDQLHNEILELGRKLSPTDISKLNGVLQRVLDLKYDVAKDAVDEYLGYK